MAFLGGADIADPGPRTSSSRFACQVFPMRFIARAASRFLVLVGIWIFCQAASAAPAFVQAKAATPQTPQASVAVAFNSAQVAGNLNVVVVGWLNSTSTVLSVTD